MTGQLVHVWRVLRRDRATVTVAVLSLALVIGESSAIFTVACSVLWQPLPFRGAVRLVHVRETLSHARAARKRSWRVQRQQD